MVVGRTAGRASVGRDAGGGGEGWQLGKQNLFLFTHHWLRGQCLQASFAWPGLAVLGAPSSYAPGEAIQVCWPCPSPLCQWKVQRTGTRLTHSETASAFLFGLSLLLSRNLCPFLLPIQGPHPNISPSWHQRLIAYLEINSPGSKRAQAVVYRVLYTMNLFAFANSLKIVPPLIVIEGSGETG